MTTREEALARAREETFAALAKLQPRAPTRANPEVLALAQSTVLPNSEIVEEIEMLQRDFGEQEGLEMARREIARGNHPRAALAAAGLTAAEVAVVAEELFRRKR